MSPSQGEEAALVAPYLIGDCNELEVLARLVVDTAPDEDWPELADLAAYLHHDEDDDESTN